MVVSQPVTAATARIAAASAGTQGRVVSLDALRGMLVVGMIIVNSPGNDLYGLRPFQHVDWNGMTFADVIAPCFLWIVGVSAALSLPRRAREQSLYQAMRHVLVRSVAIFAIGVVIPLIPAALAGPQYPILDSVKAMGILQRIGVSYLLAAPVVLYTPARVRALLAAALLAVYLAALTWFPGPLVPGATFEPHLNAAQRIDHLLLGRFAESVSHSLLTVIPAVSLMLLGSVAGDALIVRKASRSVLARTVIVGGLMLASGWLLGLWIPFNRRILTPSFVIFISGGATLTLALLYALIDRKQWRAGLLPFLALGANAIVMFAGSEIIRGLAGIAGSAGMTGQWESYWTLSFEECARWMSAPWASELVALIYTLAFIPVAIFFYRRRWILKL